MKVVAMELCFYGNTRNLWIRVCDNVVAMATINLNNVFKFWGWNMLLYIDHKQKKYFKYDEKSATLTA